MSLDIGDSGQPIDQKVRIMAKKKKQAKKAQHSDYGPKEKFQHGEYVEIETTIAGVKTVRNTTHDPIAFYQKKKLITSLQFQAAETFSHDYRKAALVAHYAHSRYNHVNGGDMPLEVLEAVHSAKQRVRNALLHIGSPLDQLVELVCGDGYPAGKWKKVAKANRPDRDGMVALRLALDSLISYYRL